MYFLSRMTLLAALAMYLYCIVIAAQLFTPYSWWLLLFFGLIAVSKNRKRLIKLTGAHGTADWAPEPELEKARMIGGKPGRLPLGRLITSAKPTFAAGVKALLDWRQFNAKRACRAFFAGLKRKQQAPLVRLPPATVNSVCFAPVGAGKSTGLAIPFLLESTDESAIVIDFKGDLALATALHRQRMGHEIAIFDPYGVNQKKLPFKTASLNALDLIDKHSRIAIDHCRAAANAIVVRTGQEHDPHWNDHGENGIGGLTAVTALYGKANNRSLQDVDRLATNPQQLAMAIQLMQQPDPTTGQYPWDGMLARMGGTMQGWSGEERSGIISTMARHLSFLRTPAIAAVTRTSSFRPQFKRTKQTAYIVCPPEFIRSMSGWIRLMIWALFTSVVNEGLGESRLVHAVLDEAASLEANFGALEDAVDKFRGYGLRCQFYYQSYGQLMKCWPKDQGTTLLSNTSAKIFAGTADLQTASLISQMLGKKTILVESGGDNESGGTNQSWSQSSHGGSASTGSNRGWQRSANWQQSPRELLKPEEILTLPPLWTITFPGPGIAPVLTHMVRHFEEPGLFKRRGGGLIARFFAACRTLTGSLILLAAAIGLAAALTQELNEQQAWQAQSYPLPGAGSYQWPPQP